jgi:hypothetical protein
MKLSSPRVWLSALALVAAGTVGSAQIERLTLDQMVLKTDDATVGTIVKSKVFRVDHPIDGPELYFTTLTVRGSSMTDGKPREIEVTFPGGFINENEGVWNSEAPSADEIRIGNRVVTFHKWLDDMGGDVSAHALYASHGGLYRVVKSSKGDIVLGKGEGYAVPANIELKKLDDQITKLAEQLK